MVPRNFWETSWFWGLVLLTASAPFWVSHIPPLMDLPGHMARYHIMRELPTSPELQRYYSFTWALMGNLGVDLIVYALKGMMSVERATWLVCLITVLLTTVSIPVLSKTVHGRVQPTALLALPFVYAHIFHFGFLNYALSVPLALLALALWIKCADLSWAKRLALFAPIAMLIWLCHSAGWGIFALCAGMVSLQRMAARHGKKLLPLLWQTGLQVVPLAVPLLFMILWRAGTSDAEAVTGYRAGFVLEKLTYVMTLLRDQNKLLDGGALFLIIVCCGVAVLVRGARLARVAAWPALAICAAFAVMPTAVFGSFYADARLAHVAAMLLIVTIAWPDGPDKFKTLIAALAIGLTATRLGMTTLAWAHADRAVTTHLTALDQVTKGARIFALHITVCGQPEQAIDYEYNHLSDMSVVRRNSFVNSQWTVPGAQSLQIIYVVDARFRNDPSQYVFIGDCVSNPNMQLTSVMADFPRDKFDYVWIAHGHLPQNLRSGLHLLYEDAKTQLFRIDRTGK